jgi:hypothetical protein
LNHPQGPISCAFSAAASAGTSVVCTLNGPNGNIVQSDDLVTFMFDTSTSGSAITSSTAQTTYAVSGFPTAATYTLILYAYVFANVYQDTAGNLKRVIL